MRNVYLYPPVKVVGQSFAGVQKQVVPKQSMSLREILKRYVRREAIPGTTEGVYEERFGDLEKLSKADIVEQMETVQILKDKISDVRKKESDRIDAAKKAEEEKKAQASKVSNEGVGVPPLNSPPPKGA